MLLVLALASCQEKEAPHKTQINVTTEPYDLEFDRYEEVLFHLDTVDFQAELIGVQDRYRVFLSGDLDQPEEVQYLKAFAIDPYSIGLYEKVKSAYPDLKQVEPMVEDVLAHFHYYYPNVELPKKAPNRDATLYGGAHGQTNISERCCQGLVYELSLRMAQARPGD